MQIDAPDRCHETFEELSRLYELLDEYGKTLVEPTNRPLHVLIFEAFHRWEVKEVVSSERIQLMGDVGYATENSRWIWLETGSWVGFVDDNGRPLDEFGLHGDTDSAGNFIADPKVLLIPDYVQSFDAALQLTGQLTFMKLQLTELEGEILTSWKAELRGKVDQRFED